MPGNESDQLNKYNARPVILLKFQFANIEFEV